MVDKLASQGLTLEEKAEGVGAEMAFGGGEGRLGGFCHLPPNTRCSLVKSPTKFTGIAGGTAFNAPIQNSSSVNAFWKRCC
jgi:hypothetical protein